MNRLENQAEYSGMLQRFVEALIDGRDVPEEVLEACPHHARLYRIMKEGLGPKDLELDGYGERPWS